MTSRRRARLEKMKVILNAELRDLLEAKAHNKTLREKLADLYGEEEYENDLKNQLTELRSQHMETTDQYRQLERELYIFQKYSDTYGPDNVSELEMQIKLGFKHFAEQKTGQPGQSTVATRRHRVLDAGRALEPPDEDEQPARGSFNTETSMQTA